MNHTHDAAAPAYNGRHVSPVDESTPISRAADNVRHAIAATFWRIVGGTPAPETVGVTARFPQPNNPEG